MRIVRLAFKMPKEIVIPVPVPGLKGFLTFLIVVGISIAFIGDYQIGKANGYFEAKLRADKSEPVTVYENNTSINDVYSKFMHITVGDDITINECGWTYLGYIHTKSISGAYVFGREYNDSIEECPGGRLFGDLESRFQENSLIIRLHNQGIKKFMYIFEPI